LEFVEIPTQMIITKMSGLELRKKKKSVCEHEEEAGTSIQKTEKKNDE
jgi:hypothetical protein